MGNKKQPFYKGMEAEDLSCKYLLENNHVILCRRYKSKYGEIDIISIDPDNYLVFIEVKYRKNLDNLYYSISDRQKNRIQDTANIFLSEHHQYLDYNMRFDVIFITKNIADKQIYYLTNAWSVE